MQLQAIPSLFLSCTIIILGTLEQGVLVQVSSLRAATSCKRLELRLKAVALHFQELSFIRPTFGNVILKSSKYRTLLSSIEI